MKNICKIITCPHQFFTLPPINIICNISPSSSSSSSSISPPSRLPCDHSYYHPTTLSLYYWKCLALSAHSHSRNDTLMPQQQSSYPIQRSVSHPHSTTRWAPPTSSRAAATVAAALSPTAAKRRLRLHRRGRPPAPARAPRRAFVLRPSESESDRARVAPPRRQRRRRRRRHLDSSWIRPPKWSDWRGGSETTTRRRPRRRGP